MIYSSLGFYIVSSIEAENKSAMALCKSNPCQNHFLIIHVVY